MTKVVLVQPPDPPNTQILRDHMGKFGIIQPGIKSLKYDLLPPLDLAYSASMLEKEGHDVKIVDSSALGLSSKQVLKEIMNGNPDMVVINASSVAINEDLDFATNVKIATNATIVITGPHVTLFPKNALEKKLDLVVCGEIENTILELTKKSLNPRNIQGVCYKKNASVICNQKRPAIENLNELPFPAFHLLPMKKYRYHLLKKKPFTTFLSSRGCPYGCIYCPYPLGYGDTWRSRTPENVMGELKLLVEKHKIKSILFRDQVFTFDNNRTEKICDEIIKEGLDIDWRCETRIDRISKNLMIKMKKAGCVGIHFGVESGDPEILKRIAKSGLTVDLIKKTFKDAKEIGLGTVAFFMIGLPEETKESIKRTLILAKELKSDVTWFTAVVPYPGTKLFNLAEDKGWILTKDWRKYSGREVVMRTDGLTEEDINTALQEAKKMFLSKTDLIKMLFTIKGLSILFSRPKTAIKFALNKVRG